MISDTVEKRVQTICLLILSTVAVAVSLFWLQNVLIPVVLAFFLTIVLNPVVGIQVRKLRLPRSVAVATTVFLGFTAMALLSLVISIAISQFTGYMTTYQSQVEKVYSQIMEALPLEKVGVDKTKLLNPLSASPDGRVGDLLFGALRSVFNIASQALLVLIFLFFLLVGKSPNNPASGTVWGEIDVNVKRYLIVKTLMSVVVGIIVWAILAVVGVPMALTFGVLVFLLNYVPNIGSIIATLLPLPIVLVDPSISTAEAIIAIALPTVVQFLLGNLVEPKLMGTSLDLHPATILLALIFWGTMWGIVGMLLAAPITAILRILLEKLEITAPLAHIMAGRLKGRERETGDRGQGTGNKDLKSEI